MSLTRRDDRHATTPGPATPRPTNISFHTTIWHYIHNTRVKNKLYFIVHKSYYWVGKNRRVDGTMMVRFMWLSSCFILEVFLLCLAFVTSSYLLSLTVWMFYCEGFSCSNSRWHIYYREVWTKLYFTSLICVFECSCVALRAAKLHELSFILLKV